MRVVLGSLIVNWLPLAPGSHSRVGVITSRKVGGAVARNRMRRRMREMFRVHQHELHQPVDLILVARPSMADKAMAEVRRDFLAALRKARLL